eukprot:m.339165 g.339165  ORF g.339165 m.339165 type:complete len:184 (+) comp18691_c0_seq1:119-670(+)
MMAMSLWRRTLGVSGKRFTVQHCGSVCNGSSNRNETCIWNELSSEYRILRTMAGKAGKTKAKKAAAKVAAEAAEAAAFNFGEMMNQAVPVKERQRPKLTGDQLDDRARKVKEWSRYRIKEEHNVYKRLSELSRHRDAALDELKQLDIKLYYKAIEVDETLWPLHFPVATHTPSKPSTAEDETI